MIVEVDDSLAETASTVDRKLEESHTQTFEKGTDEKVRDKENKPENRRNSLIIELETDSGEGSDDDSQTEEDQMESEELSGDDVVFVHSPQVSSPSSWKYDETKETFVQVDTPVPIEIIQPVSPEIGKVQYDRFGYEIVNPVELSASEQRLIERDKQVEAKREKKWAKMTQNWALFSKTNKRKLAARIKKGIPDSFRSKAWFFIIDPEGAFESPSGRESVDHYIQMGPQTCWDTIEVDLRRTMPHVEVFSHSNIIDSLRRILKAYSNVDPELGYTQGMAFTASMLLMYLDEATTFWCFHQLMNSPRYSFREYYLSGFPKLIEVNEIWSILFQRKYPRIKEKFDTFNIQPVIYTPSWFLCAFMNMPFLPVLRLRIFDRYIAFGSRALLSFGLVIISRHKRLLLSGTADTILSTLIRPYESPMMCDWRYVIEKWDKLWITQNDYQRVFKKAKISPFP